MYTLQIAALVVGPWVVKQRPHLAGDDLSFLGLATGFEVLEASSYYLIKLLRHLLDDERVVHLRHVRRDLAAAARRVDEELHQLHQRALAVSLVLLYPHVHHLLQVIRLRDLLCAKCLNMHRHKKN